MRRKAQVECHAIWCEGLAPGSWLKCHLGGPHYMLYCSACVVLSTRRVVVAYWTAAEERAAITVSAALRSLGYNIAVDVDGREEPWATCLTSESRAGAASADE